MTQWFLNYMNALNLPVYTAPNINGALLDWVALGLYGLTRPVLPSGTSKTIGPLNTWELNTIKLNFRETIGPTQVFQTTDDIFKRIITWSFYKGDGFNFSIPWLKRRVMRFLYGVNGTDFIIDRTYPVSVSFGTDYQVDITLVNGEATVKSGAFLNTFKLNTIKLNSLVSVFVPVSTPPLGPVLQSAINAGVLPLPFQYTYVVTI
jgi:hypothetical protein